ncbi:MAG: cobyric acid synthase, partial [Bacteroidales bacterium]|nr:cobyric acid synthase [Bacteroidales bacterium]
DIIIIPGSKNTIGDLLDLRKRGIAKAILQAHKAEKAIYGICAGFQMMGKEVHDPYHVEGEINSVPGLGILPHITTLTEEKVTEQCKFHFLGETQECIGYEIHMGETLLKEKNGLNKLKNGKTDGYFLNPKTWGTYIHGIFDNELIIRYIIRENGPLELNASINYAAFKEEQYDKLAKHVRENVDMQAIYKSLQILH